MPHGEQQHGQRNGRKLEARKVHLVGLQLPIQALCRLRETKRRSQVHQQRHDREHGAKDGQARVLDGAARAHEKRSRENDEYTHGEDLIRQAAEEDVVRRRGVLPAGGAHTDEGRARDLHDGGDDIRGDEEGEDDLGRQKRIAAAEAGDQRREHRVDARGEEHGRGDDEEVVEDKVDEVVGVALRGEGARDVADNLEEQADGKGDEPPAAEADRLEGVHDEEEEEPGGGEGGEGDGGRVAVDDDGRVPLAVGVGEVWVDVPARAVYCVVSVCECGF